MYEYGKAYRNYGTEHKLRQEQIHMIDLIGSNTDCNLRFLADAVGSNLATVSLQVNRLAKMGLVSKRRSNVSQRELEINLTDDGWKAFAYHRQLDDNFFSATASNLSRYSDEQLETIRDFIVDVLMNDPIY